MRKLIVAALFLLLIVPAAPRAHAQAYNARPRLVVLLVIDQFRGDYLDRYRDSFTSVNGFNLFLKKGAYFNGCYFDYANTKTAPGHATIGTRRVYGRPWHQFERVVGPEPQHRPRHQLGGGRALPHRRHI